MDDLQSYVFINSILVYQHGGGVIRLCATEPHLQLKRFPPEQALNSLPLDQQASIYSSEIHSVAINEFPKRKTRK